MSGHGLKVFEKPPIEESYDYAEQVRRQIERCLEASAIQDNELREGTYKACVLALSHLVPFDDRDEDYTKAIDSCTVEEEYYLFKTRGGTRIGHIGAPLCYPSRGPPWSEKPKGEMVPYSPILKTRTVTNWGKYFMVLFNKFVELKVTVRRGSYNA